MFTVGQDIWISEQLFISAGFDISGDIRFPEIKLVHKTKVIGFQDQFWELWEKYPQRRAILPSKVFATKGEAVANSLAIIDREEARLKQRLEELEKLRQQMLAV